YLVESARGEGLGRRLMDACADHARALGCGRLTLEVNADNRAARGLYRSLGFDIPEETGPSGSTFFVKCPLDRYGQMKTKTT
ncbi:MAG: GNAT family N-acetyltransferase, partial [Planctomycetota bacterium]|nr:GNAT family N-acetyltransferase [Planctomycetota bacterium]